jgi:hypothetical protein
MQTLEGFEGSFEEKRKRAIAELEEIAARKGVSTQSLQTEQEPRFDPSLSPYQQRLQERRFGGL